MKCISKVMELGFGKGSVSDAKEDLAYEIRIRQLNDLLIRSHARHKLLSGGLSTCFLSSSGN